MLLHVVALLASRACYRIVPCGCSRICPAACTRQCFVHAYTAGSLGDSSKDAPRKLIIYVVLFTVLPMRSKKLPCQKVSPWKFIQLNAPEGADTAAPGFWKVFFVMRTWRGVMITNRLFGAWWRKKGAT